MMQGIEEKEYKMKHIFIQTVIEIEVQNEILRQTLEVLLQDIYSQNSYRWST